MPKIIEPEVSEFDRLDILSPIQLTTLYLKWRKDFRGLINKASRISRGSSGIYCTEPHYFYASVLFTRLLVTAKSIEHLLPDCRPREHWDFSAVASLVRNLFEAYLLYFWLCEEEVADEIREARRILLYCHDNGSRERMFPEQATSPEHEEVVADLIAKFDANSYLKTFDEKARRKALKGHKTPFIQDDVIESIGFSKEDSRVIYRFFSQHTHSGPVSFLRMVEHGRGTGVETAHEKEYMIIALMQAVMLLTAAIEGHLKLFPEAETRVPSLTDAEVARNVEIAQGRKKAKRG